MQQEARGTRDRGRPIDRAALADGGRLGRAPGSGENLNSTHPRHPLDALAGAGALVVGIPSDVIRERDLGERVGVAMAGEPMHGENDHASHDKRPVQGSYSAGLSAHHSETSVPDGARQGEAFSPRRTSHTSLSTPRSEGVGDYTSQHSDECEAPLTLPRRASIASVTRKGYEFPG